MNLTGMILGALVGGVAAIIVGCFWSARESYDQGWRWADKRAERRAAKERPKKP